MRDDGIVAVSFNSPASLAVEPCRNKGGWGGCGGIHIINRCARKSTTRSFQQSRMPTYSGAHADAQLYWA